jgi:hypothetical protein
MKKLKNIIFVFPLKEKKIGLAENPEKSSKINREFFFKNFRYRKSKKFFQIS